MEPADYIRILRKRWWIILVAIVFTAGSAYVFTKMLLRTYMTVADSDQWAQRVIDELQLPMRPEQLRADARFAAEDDRMVIKIEIEAYDGDLANDIARTWANLLVQWRDQQNQYQRKEDRVYAYLRDMPRYSQSWPPSTKIMLGAGGVFGLVIAGVVIFFLEWLEAGVIRTPQDLERQLNLTVVGAIPSTD
jgi:capsular polysaccharide biosynthesis protein